MATDEFILKEDGFHITLEDGSGSLLLEDPLSIIPEGGGSGRVGVGTMKARHGAGKILGRSGSGEFTGRQGRGSF